MKEIFESIDFKQQKYKVAALSYVLFLLLGWLLIFLFQPEEKDEIIDSNLQTTESLNAELPKAQMQNEGIDNKYDSMLKSYGKIQDYSAVENIDRDNADDDKESYDSKYTDEDLAFLDQKAADRSEELEQLVAMQDKLRKSAEKGKEIGAADDVKPMTEEERLAASEKRQQDALAELSKALAEARLKGQNATTQQGVSVNTESAGSTGKVEINTDAVNAPADNEAAGAVVKKVRTSSDYFNTLSDNESEPKLIKAIIDENVTAVDGSRVRLRLLDDVEINEVIMPKGSYIYATMSGFGSQRVKGNVKSLMIGDEIVKVSLAIYDTDGLEGLYVPSSSFRETSQDIASSALSSNMSMNSGSYKNSLSQWGLQAMQSAYQQTTNAISKAVKKNKAKLKYGTSVYLINTKDKSNN